MFFFSSVKALSTWVFIGETEPKRITSNQGGLGWRNLQPNLNNLAAPNGILAAWSGQVVEPAAQQPGSYSLDPAYPFPLFKYSMYLVLYALIAYNHIDSSRFTWTTPDSLDQIKSDLNLLS